MDCEFDFDFNEPADGANRLDRAADLIVTLQMMFEHHRSTQKDLEDAAEMLERLHHLQIDRSSPAWDEIERLGRVLSKRKKGTP